MREIKFRAWDGTGMMDWDWFKLQPCATDWLEQGATGPDWVVMQYTGIKDMDGREIYEDDICRVWATYDYDRPVPTKQIKSIRWNQTRACFNIYQGKRLEIIGNIYENPELTHNTEQPSLNQTKGEGDATVGL